MEREEEDQAEIRDVQTAKQDLISFEEWGPQGRGSE